LQEPYYELKKEKENFLGTPYDKKYYNVDYVNLAKLWTEGWRPINIRTLKPNEVPEEYQTKIYKDRSQEENKRAVELLIQEIGAESDEKRKKEGKKTTKEIQKNIETEDGKINFEMIGMPDTTAWENIDINRFYDE
jgi:hypothetical protein